MAIFTSFLSRISNEKGEATEQRAKQVACGAKSIHASHACVVFRFSFVNLPQQFNFCGKMAL